MQLAGVLSSQTPTVPFRGRTREVEGLTWATTCGAPAHAKRNKYNRVQKKGISYENKVGKYLESMEGAGRLRPYTLVRNQWFHFRDLNGKGYAQIDFLLVSGNEVFILESKLTQTNFAVGQLRELYYPLVLYCYKRPVRLVQVCKTLVERPRRLLVSLEEVLRVFPSHPTEVLTWQFLGM